MKLPSILETSQNSFRRKDSTAIRFKSTARPGRTQASIIGTSMDSLKIKQLLGHDSLGEDTEATGIFRTLNYIKKPEPSYYAPKALPTSPRKKL